MPSSASLPILTLTVTAGAAVEASRFIKQDGTYAAAGAGAFGVTRTSAGSGDLVAVDVQGTALVESGAAIAAADTALMVDATGRVVTLAGAGKTPIGKAMASASAAGELIEVLLTPVAGLVTA